MADSTDKKTRSRRSKFDADLDAMLDKAELSFNPIIDPMEEDAIDRLLIDDGFDLEDESNQADNEKYEPTMENEQYLDDALLEAFAEDGGQEESEPLMDDVAGMLAEPEQDADELDVKLDLVSSDLALAADDDEDQPADIAEADLDGPLSAVGLTEAEDDLDAKLAQAGKELALDSDDDFDSAEPESVIPETDQDNNDRSDVDELDLKLQLASADFDLTYDPDEQQEVDLELDDAATAQNDFDSDDLLDDEADIPDDLPLFAAEQQDLDVTDSEAEHEDALVLMEEQEAELAQQIDAEAEQELSADSTISKLYETDLSSDAQGDIDHEEEQIPDALPAIDEFADDLTDLALAAADGEVEQDTDAVLPKQSDDEQADFSALNDDDTDSIATSAIADMIDMVHAEQDVIEAADPEQSLDDTEQDLFAQMAELDDVDDSVIAADPQQSPIIDEFADDVDLSAFIQDDESELASQIAADLLDDNDLLGEDSFSSDDLISDDSDAFKDLEIISDDAESAVIDEFSDDLVSSSDEFDFADEDEFSDDSAAYVADQISEDVSAEDDFLLADFDITADAVDAEQPAAEAEQLLNNPFGDDSPLFDDSADEIAAESLAPAIDVETDQIAAQPQEETAAAEEDGVAALALAQFKSEQESFNKQQKKLLSDIESKAKKSAVFTYTALGFGVLALGFAVYLGVVAHNSKNEVSKLNEVIVGLEKKLAIAPIAPPPAELAAEPPLPAETTPAASSHAEVKDAAAADAHNKPGEHKDLAKGKAIVEHHEAKAPEPDKAATDSVKPESDQHHEKPGLDYKETEAKSNSANKPEHTNEPAEAKAADKLEQTAKLHTTELDKALAKRKPVLIEEVANEPTKNKAADSSKDSTQEPDKPKSADKAKAVAKKKPVKPAGEQAQEKSVAKAVAGGDWAVNLIAFKQDWYAKAKANEFRQKGVPVDVVTVDVNNVTWYRLRVGGFSGKADASAYAGRVKKALNLSSVWVGK
ncbi:MAG: SPOR domain-containing protein [Methylococcales bacterium]